MSKGFTLVELLVVIAIVGGISVLVGVNFMKLIGNTDQYEKENLYKYLNEAACVYVDSKDSNLTADSYYKTEDGVNVGSDDLYQKGYIDENSGLLKKYSIDDIKKYEIQVKWNSGEKKCCVSKFNGAIVSGKGACS